jgi:hypothetical protein
LASFATDQTPEVGSRLVLASLLDGVALGAPLDERLLALVDVSTAHCGFFEELELKKSKFKLNSKHANHLQRYSKPDFAGRRAIKNIQNF